MAGLLRLSAQMSYLEWHYEQQFFCFFFNMGSLISMAMRNLLRNRRRSLTTLLAMMIGLVTILVFGGYSRNVILAMETGYVQLHGHLQIQRKDYYLYGSGNPAAYGMADYQSLIEQLKRDPVLSPMLTMVTPKLQLGGIAGNFAAGVSKM